MFISYGIRPTYLFCTPYVLPLQSRVKFPKILSNLFTTVFEKLATCCGIKQTLRDRFGRSRKYSRRNSIGFV